MSQDKKITPYDSVKKRDQSLDDFWDVGRLLPTKPKQPKYSPVTQRKAPEAVQQAAAALTGDAAVEEVAEEAVEEPAVADPGAVRGEEPAAQQPDAPNPNPVEAAPAVAPRTADGKIDVAKLVDPADFADWDEWGCKS